MERMELEEALLKGLPVTERMREAARIGDEEQDYVQEVYALFSAGNGMMDVQNMANAMDAVELPISREERRAFVEQFRGRKQVTFAEFFRLVELRMLVQVQRQRMGEVYRHIASDPSVGITAEDLRRTFREFSEDVDDTTIERMVREACERDKTAVSFGKFMRVMKTTETSEPTEHVH